ncbi:zf-HC2 domain-containing protein [Halobacillus shinanisalinarum]|uniref:Anti-sigma-W factor RsiW n=1 Tax=Halobacillus shinanisalinarum TaxID=2932258 RepID=A0ABY4GWL7_9BACI|nr:zf-HC2 domain-containing protein [Halobacillus shinanisalinarum]UOQ92513.1 zf-HC2 domain-containing protein [Halobacillus shinanisalinarum]
MKHVAQEVLQMYLANELSDGERIEVEDHLDECEHCFHRYMTSLHLFDPDFLMSPSFTEDTMNEIRKKTPAQGKQNKTFIHYAIAAGLTIVLMGSGVFQYVFTVFDEEQFHNGPSITEKMMEGTDRWMTETERGMGNE